MDYFVTEEYIDQIYNLIDGYKSDRYYANMALAWLIAELYIKFPESTKEFFKKCNFFQPIPANVLFFYIHIIIDILDFHSIIISTIIDMSEYKRKENKK